MAIKNEDNLGLAHKGVALGCGDRSDKRGDNGMTPASHEDSLVRFSWAQAGSVAAALKQVVTEYLEQQSVRSVAYLARKSGIPYTTVRRIVQEQGRADLATINSILNVIMERDEHLMFIRFYYPDCYHMLASTFSPSRVEPRKKCSRSAPFDPAANSIVRICADPEGVLEDEARSQIKEQYGGHGLKRYESLKRNGYLAVKGAKVYLKSERFELNTAASILLRIQILTDIFNVRHIGTDAAMIGLMSEYVSDEGLALLKAAGKEYLRKVLQAQHKHKGKELIYYLGVMQNIYDQADDIASQCA